MGIFISYLLNLHELCATGTTVEIIEKELGIRINKLQSDHLGGDQQTRARIAGAKLNFLIFSEISLNLVVMTLM